VLVDEAAGRAGIYTPLPFVLAAMVMALSNGGLSARNWQPTIDQTENAEMHETF
jgi:hypothetical protein